MKERPLLGITMGDPAGIGPEITVKALADPVVYEQCRPLVIGDAEILSQALKLVGEEKLRIHSIEKTEEGIYHAGTIDVLHLPSMLGETLVRGRIDAVCGRAAYQAIEKSIQLALNGEIDGTITNPIHKEALNKAGYPYSGHTEIYAELTETKSYTMLLVCGELRVVHVSTHVSLARACELVKKNRILEVIRIADKACRELGIEAPKIGVAGLNPHCGEGGLFGSEEKEEIKPAVEAALTEGINCEGPVPADTIFSKAIGGLYDCVVAMYHDQGHIPLKVKGFEYDRAMKKWKAVDGVNITLGLPVIRTSVDHGTAFDQAGTGMASEVSLKNAITYAVRLTECRAGTVNVHTGSLL